MTIALAQRTRTTLVRRIDDLGSRPASLPLARDFHGDRVFEWDDDGLSIRALGAVEGFEASSAQALLQLEQHIEGDDATGLPVWVGGRSFHRHDGVDEWTSWPGQRFWVPRILWVQTPTTTLRITHGLDGVSDDYPAELGHRLRPEQGSVRPVEHEESWCRSVEQTLAAISDRAFDKAVLARRALVTGPVSPSATVEQLGVGDGMTRYRVNWPDAGEFVGATPETLIATRPGHLATESLAGTAASSDADALLRSDKDRAEQRWVTDAIRDEVARHCDAVDVEGPGVAVFGEICHLRTTVTATPRIDEGVLPWVERLHPSPAVCGWPREPAMRFIRATEPFDRGWFGGALGWSDGASSGRVVVALRCGLIHPSSVHIYAGAGVVTGSDPRGEWAETALKMRRMAQALARRTV